MIDILERLDKKASQKLREGLETVDVSLPESLGDFKQQVFDADVLIKSLGAVASGVSAGAGAYAAVGLLGTASTGAAINGLAGAAAHNAVMAWLGGGAIAAGGGGMAAGALVMGGIVAAPALLIGGFVLASKGEQALTEARAHEAKVNVQIAQVDSIHSFISKVGDRIFELHDLCWRINARVETVITSLEKRGRIDPAKPEHVKLFQQAMLLTRALSEIMKVPVIEGKDAKLSISSGQVVVKYRELGV